MLGAVRGYRERMELVGKRVVTRRVQATPEDVWAVLADGWSYVAWVVGASRMRAVDADWPADGAKLHHSAGVWPALIDDETQVVGTDPGRRIELIARGRPLGEARVTITVEADGGGSVVRLVEDVVSGVSRIVPRQMRQLALLPRNVETLRRLGFLAERRTAPDEIPDRTQA